MPLIRQKYHGNLGHNLGRIQHISLMNRNETFYAACGLETQTVTPTLNGLKSINRCIQYLASPPHKPIAYSYNSYDRSNFIRLTWSGNQAGYYTTQNCLGFYQDAYHARILKSIRSVSGIMLTLLGDSVCWKVQIQSAIASYSNGGDIRYTYKTVNKTKAIWKYM